jgi:thiopeptide-type bacteriocin biosynthesis protein
MPNDHAKTVPAAAGPGKAARAPLYRALPTALLRAPLLPLDVYGRLSSRAPGEVEAALGDPRVRLALLVGSRSLCEALERSQGDERVRSRLLRYLIRMSSRPTPYGMFAGVCLAHLSEATDFALSGEERRRIRPDMAWLIQVIATLEGLPEVRERLRVVVNPAAYLRAGRFVLPARSALAESGRAPEVSIRASGAVRRALERAGQPVAYADVRDELLADPRATPDKVGHLLTCLMEQTFLLSDLRPPLTGGDPARHVLDRLAGIEAARPIREELGALLGEASAWEESPAEEAGPAYRRLLDRAGRLVPREAASTPFQVDLFLVPERTRIHQAVGDEVCRAAELLLRLSPCPEGPPALASYRQAFLSRYGLDREVPVLELLDGNLGLGAYAPRGAPPQAVTPRERVLMEIAAAAQRTLCPSVDVDEPLLSRLGAEDLSPERAPVSLDLCVFIAARSAPALDAGEFTVVVGPNVGATAAGRVLGRFAEGLGEPGVDLLRRIAAEEEAARPTPLRAELVYLPHRSRTANVSIRPGVRSHEISVGLQPGLTRAESIPLRELVVGVRDDRFYLRWPKAGREVHISSGHMLNAAQGPDVCRFLSDLSLDGAPLLMWFDWGRAASFPYLPRVRSGRVVLRPAEWRIDDSCRRSFFPLASRADFPAELERWRRTWAVPRHVFLTTADNRLLLDLEDAEQAAELRAEIGHLVDGAHVILQEVLPALHARWAEGPAGAFYTELCVSLVQRPPPRQARAPLPPSPGGAPAETTPLPAGRRGRLFPPGSEWAYLKLYSGPDLQGDLLAGPVRELAGRLLEARLADQWFFLRYTDPDHHLRLRFRCLDPGPRSRLVSELSSFAAALLDRGLCLRFAFDTYDPEIERYGGPEAILLAEQIFGVDSSSVVEHLALLDRHRGLEPRNLVVATTDNLLLALEPQPTERMRWLRARRGDKRRSGPEYRERGALLSSLVAPRGASPLPPEIRSNLERTRLELRALAEGLAALRDRALLSQPMDRLLAHYAHMHFNRLIGIDPDLEQLTLALLHRTRETIAHAGGQPEG